jgi:hypothetical protein
MTKFRTMDRALALRCKLAREDGREITVSYRNGRGIARVTGMVRSVRPNTDRRAKPFWDVTMVPHFPVSGHSGERSGEDARGGQK